MVGCRLNGSSEIRARFGYGRTTQRAQSHNTARAVDYCSVKSTAVFWTQIPNTPCMYSGLTPTYRPTEHNTQFSKSKHMMEEIWTPDRRYKMAACRRNKDGSRWYNCVSCTVAVNDMRRACLCAKAGNVRVHVMGCPLLGNQVRRVKLSTEGMSSCNQLLNCSTRWRHLWTWRRWQQWGPHCQSARWRLPTTRRTPNCVWRSNPADYCSHRRGANERHASNGLCECMWCLTLKHTFNCSVRQLWFHGWLSSMESPRLGCVKCYPVPKKGNVFSGFTSIALHRSWG